MQDLEDLGFRPSDAHSFQPFGEEGCAPGRIAVAQREQYLLYTAFGELPGELSGRLRHEAAAGGPLPATGDWVAIRPRPAEGRAVVHALLPRRTCLSRKVAGAMTREQVVAANVDTVFLVCGLDGDFNPRRIERGLVLAWESGAKAVVVLNKADLCESVPARVVEARAVAGGTDVHVLSCVRDEGVDELRAYLGRGETAVLVGSSGVGKSTLTNRLVGRLVNETREVRPWDSRGRHTTTRRELIALPSGGWIIDTPGVRELQLWVGEGSASTDAVFADVAALAASCRFSDCRHAGEPGCTVSEALSTGTLDPERFANYEKMRRELRHLAARQDGWERRAERQRQRALMRAANRFYRDRGKRR
jgi:ribosome biogenesis GTPase / thiamine phosphate phosphatase